MFVAVGFLKVAPYIFNILEPLSFNGVIEPFFIT